MNRTKHNKKKSKQLGQPYGTAANRLRKALMFKLAQETGMDRCFRCQQVIDDIREFSIDHKLPWLDTIDPVGNYFDLQNVAFAHLICNITHTRFTDSCKSASDRRRKVGPPGTAWCGRRKHFQPIANFHRNRTKWNGVSSICKTCSKEYHCERSKH